VNKVGYIPTSLLLVQIFRWTRTQAPLGNAEA
jgi:hypothetical protein